MSREFGSCPGGYLHEQISVAGEDLCGGRDPLTRLWGEFFREFSDIAYAICSSEASDSCPDDPIIENIRRMSALRECLKDIEDFLDPYKRVANEAIRQQCEAKRREEYAKQEIK